MTISIKGELTCKGRNGYFEHNKTDVRSTSLTARDEVFIELYSARVGKHAPLVVSGWRDEVIAYSEKLLDAARNA